MGNSSAFALWPYLASGVFVAGVFLRYLLTLRQPGSLEAELGEAKQSFAGRIWWTSLIILLAGHLGELLFPRALLSWNATPLRLYMLEGIAGLTGLAAVISSIALIVRYLRRPTVSLLTELFETVFLAVLFASVVSGVLAAILYRWGSSWGATILTPYVISLLRGAPAADLAAQMPFLVRLHVLSAFAALALVPLTRLSAFLVAALHRCLVIAGAPARVTASAVNRWIARHNPSRWFWPEED